MAMEINGSYSTQTGYLDRLREEQPLDKTGKTQEPREEKDTCTG